MTNINGRKYIGFTLAEVLITLLIVGVISSLVIPALINDTNDTELKTMWAKQFGVISQAFYQIQYENGWYIDTSSGSNLLNELGTKMSFVKTGPWRHISNLPADFYYKCYKATDSTNYCSNWQNKSYYSHSFWPTAATNDGAFIFIRLTDPDCNAANYRVKLSPSDPNGIANLCAEIPIDVNGDKGPNMIGKDYQLAVLLKSNGRYYFKPSGSNLYMTCEPGHPDNANYSLGCAQKALLNEPLP